MGLIILYMCSALTVTELMNLYAVELQWLEHHENMFETGVVRANEC